MPIAPIDEDELSPGDLCERFEIPRTTLFRWEERGDIPKTRRGARDSRIYRREHVEAVARLVRDKTGEEYKAANEGGERPQPEALAQLWERLYLADYFGGPDPRHALDQLRGLARATRLSSRAVRVLVQDAQRRPIGDEARVKIWEILLALDVNTNELAHQGEERN